MRRKKYASFIKVVVRDCLEGNEMPKFDLKI